MNVFFKYDASVDRSHITTITSGAKVIQSTFFYLNYINKIPNHVIH